MRKSLILLCSIFSFAFISSANASHTIYYTAKITNNDRYNSKGKKLNSIASILRQDRANVHKFGLADKGDQRDRFFRKARNRNIFNHAKIKVASRHLARQIVRGRKAVWITVAYNPKRNLIEIHQPD